MRPCMRDRWGKVDCAERTSDTAAETAARKEADAKMVAMLHERQRQDAELWGDAAAVRKENNAANK